MTRELLLLRHAKSDWGADFEADIERPLAKRGVRAASTIGRVLDRLDLGPELIVTSPAARARQTVELAREAGQWQCPVEFSGAFYEGGPKDALAVLRRISDPIERLLAVGHEPALSELAGRLVGEAQLRLPTACLVRIDIRADTWSDLAWGSGVLVAVLPVRTLQGVMD